MIETQTPVRVNAMPAHVHALFTFGPTKCAVILFDLVNLYDRKFGGNSAHRVVSRYLNDIDTMTNMVRLAYLADKAKRLTSLNMLVRQSKSPFKEHLIYEISATRLLWLREMAVLPDNITMLMRAVTVERINKVRIELDISAPAKRGIGYKTADLIAWINEPIVIAARGAAARSWS